VRDDEVVSTHEMSKAEGKDRGENGNPSEDHEDHRPFFPSRLDQHHATLLSHPRAQFRGVKTAEIRLRSPEAVGVFS